MRYYGRGCETNVGETGKTYRAGSTKSLGAPRSSHEHRRLVGNRGRQVDRATRILKVSANSPRWTLGQSLSNASKVTAHHMSRTFCQFIEKEAREKI